MDSALIWASSVQKSASMDAVVAWATPWMVSASGCTGMAVS
jgi:hypothetical protein